MGVDLQANSELLSDLVEEAIACTPETWDRGVLTIECDGSYIQYKLKSDASPDKAQISQHLRGLCEQYYVSMAQQGAAWIAAAIEFCRENGNWKFNVAFTYPDPETPQGSMRAGAQKRPWWKVWN